MSDAGFNDDDLLEKELFGGDSDDADAMGMDVDGMLGMDASDGLGINGDDQPDTPAAAAGGGSAKEAAGKEQAALSSEADAAGEGSTKAVKGKQPDTAVAAVETAAAAAAAVAPKPDIEMDDPPGALTMLERPARTPDVSVAPGLSTCATYEITPTMAFLIPASVHAVSATDDMRWVFSGGSDGYIRKWDFFASVNGKQPLTLGQRHAHVDSVTKGGVCASYWDHTDAASDDLSEGPLSPVYALAAHSRGMWVASGMQSGHVALWSVRHDEGRRVALLGGKGKHARPVSVLCRSPDEFGLVSGSWDRAALYWDLDSGRVARAFVGHTSQISAIAFQPAQGAAEGVPRMMTTSIDGQCFLWDVRQATTAATAMDRPAERFDPAVRTPPWAAAACWSADGRRLYVGRRNNTVDEYDVRMDGRPVRSLRLPMNSGPVTALAAMPNGRSLVCASTDNVRVWDLEAAAERRGVVPFQIIPGHHGGCVSAVFVDCSARYLLTMSGNRGWEGDRPFVILDDYFVRDEFLSSLHQNIDTSELGITPSDNGKYFEIDSGTPFLKHLLTHLSSGRWLRSNDVRITYSRWLYCMHVGIIASVTAKYISGLSLGGGGSGGSLVHALGTLGNICLLLVLSFHLVFFVALNFRPRWFEVTVVFHSPFAWAAIWLMIIQGDRHEIDVADGRARGAAGEHWAVSALSRRVGPLGLLLMHVFIWYTRRTVIGVAVFERKTRASLAAYWMHRIYSILAALFIVLVWRWYPLVTAGVFNLQEQYSAAGQATIGKLVRESAAAERGMIGWLRILATMVIAGGFHVAWYSFISYAYHMIVWKQYLRDGLAVWVTQEGAMCTKLV
ncbi:Transcription factor spt8 [Coemansia erecta]|uniref:Transcription factor spt8 n=1 Tax=Coemansia erecta TaxID=147472 RepID=A0A9W8CTK2_9FUNG|nr:Transcription factor spt8 [Coemansia erecta]